MDQEPVRLSKLLSARGICSRREADRYIEAGLVIVDGETISTLGTKVRPDAEIELHRKAEAQQKAKVTIVLHKPLGYVSMPEDKGYPVATELLTRKQLLKTEGSPQFSTRHTGGLGVAGRLDVDSKGLLILSQDGTVVKHIIGPDSRLEKEYIVRVEGRVSREAIEKLRHGLHLDGEALRPAEVELIEPQLIQIVLQQGKKRQIRRMCDLVGLRVVKLKRVRVGKLRLGDLPEGCWRYLGPDEEI